MFLLQQFLKLCTGRKPADDRFSLYSVLQHMQPFRKTLWIGIAVQECLIECQDEACIILIALDVFRM
jgi:hypothetical protein